MSTRDFLVEVGTEELPPKSLLDLAEAFRAGIAQGLDAASIKHGEVKAYATPRRLAVIVRRLAESQPDQEIKRRGPPVSAAFDSAGNPTRAGQAFADSCGVALADLGRVQEAKGEFLFHSGTKPGAATTMLLPGIVQQSLDALPVARRMRWGAGEAQFVRPVHWLVMLFGNEVVPCTLLGITAGNVTRGHRFHAPGGIKVSSPGSWAKRLLDKGFVVADIDVRRERIRAGVIAAAQSVGGEAVISDALLDEVTALVEWPAPVAGRIEERFLDLPPEVLISTIQDHQRYFPVRDAAGRLMPNFIAVANIQSRDPEQVRIGNERVVRPRLADSAFFFATDRQQTLAARRETLRSVTFQAQLGSLYDKTARVAPLAASIAAQIGADAGEATRAAQISKCDLLTNMVGEFPELQGLMGSYYARLDGEAADVATAMEEQYRPRFAGDALPATGVGLALALADKLDTLVGIFAIGQKPSGTRDPFALRRAALGMLRIIIENRLELDLTALVATALRGVQADIERIAAAATDKKPAVLPAAAQVAGDVYDYVMERLRAYYLERPTTDGGAFTTEMFDAVLAKRPGSPLDFDSRLKALAAFLSLPDAASLASANKRIANILRKSGLESFGAVDPARLTHVAEQRLHDEVEALRGGVEVELGQRRYEGALRRLASLRPAVDGFFDGVMVMDEDPDIRANRLALLAGVQALFLHTADLTRLPG
ncbi:MAG: glycine--tRNA ligase subunit beta [Gammaproteobacteria bacterium]|nr:glycine--tRNA ligase subunit beta [Gammaproteobacteria bacterium]